MLQYLAILRKRLQTISQLQMLFVMFERLPTHTACPLWTLSGAGKWVRVLLRGPLDRPILYHARLVVLKAATYSQAAAAPTPGWAGGNPEEGRGSRQGEWGSPTNLSHASKRVRESPPPCGVHPSSRARRGRPCGRTPAAAKRRPALSREREKGLPARGVVEVRWHSKAAR